MPPASATFLAGSIRRRGAASWTWVSWTAVVVMAFSLTSGEVE
jgi:hypothetical protein